MPGGFTCCTRGDGSQYVHLCSCPAVYLYAEGTSKNATLCGFNEYSGQGIVESDPIKKYRKKTFTLTSDQYNSCCYSDGDSNNKKVYYNYTHNGSLFKEFNANDCVISNSVDPFEINRSYSRNNYEYGCGDFLGSQTINSTYGWSNEIYQSIDSTTQVSWSYNDTSNYPADSCSGLESKDVLDYIWTLSVEDTETDALNRAIAVDHTYKSSVWETRSGSYIYFTKRTTDYCLLCTNLMVGRAYNGAIPIQKREAIKGNYGAWAAEQAGTFSFTATKPFEVIGGSLHASISDQDFIDNDYSVNPTVYGLASGTSVLVPATPLAHVQGWEYEVGTNPSSDTAYCELT